MQTLPALFEQPSFPEFDESLVERVKRVKATKQFVHFGVFASREDELCRSVCTDLLMGVSRRLIARRYSISRNTVTAIREVMEKRGELEPLKEEIMRRLNRCVIYSLENLEQALSDDTIAPGSLPIATAVLLDKKRDAEGQPTARIEHISNRRVTHEELNAWLESLPSANPKILPETGPVDSPSAVPAKQLTAPQRATEDNNG